MFDLDGTLVDSLPDIAGHLNAALADEGLATYSHAEIRRWVEERWGVSYTEGGMYALLHRLRCAPKVPRPVHEKADHLAQARWKKGGSRKPSRRSA